MFTGRRVDILDNGSLKIQYNRNRYYDYYTGRWLTHDPLGYVDDEMNLYEYVKSNPLAYSDPFGLAACTDEDCDKDVTRCNVEGLRYHIQRCWMINKRLQGNLWQRRRRIRNLIVLLTTSTNPVIAIANGLASTSIVSEATIVKVRATWDEYYVIVNFKCKKCHWRLDGIERRTVHQKGDWREASGYNQMVAGSIKDWVRQAAEEAASEAMNDFDKSKECENRKWTD